MSSEPSPLETEPPPNPKRTFPAAPKRLIPRHREVANRLIEQVANGTFPVGSLLPVESELAERFQVSRHTLREAVRHLQTLGLVTRRQGHGTVVKSNQAQRQFKLAIRTFGDIESHGFFTQLVVARSKIVTADSELARMIPCKIGARFLHVLSRRVPVDDTVPLPTAWNETYVVEDYANIRAEMGVHKGPIYMLIERMFDEKIKAIEQDVSAVELNPAVAKVLSAKARSPGLMIKRTYFGKANAPIMIGYNTYPAHPFTFNMRLEHD